MKVRRLSEMGRHHFLIGAHFPCRPTFFTTQFSCYPTSLAIPLPLLASYLSCYPRLLLPHSPVWGLGLQFGPLEGLALGLALAITEGVFGRLLQLWGGRELCILPLHIACNDINIYIYICWMIYICNYVYAIIYMYMQWYIYAIYMLNSEYNSSAALNLNTLKKTAEFLAQKINK